jgi:hypothetical protein
MNSRRTSITAVLIVLVACGSDTRAHESTPSATPSASAATSLALPSAQSPDSDVIGPAAPIGAADFVVAGIDGLMDSAAVRRTMGAPDSVQVIREDDSSELTVWHYAGMEVTFGSDSTVFSIELHGRETAAARGVRVGDASSRVRALYGTPSDSTAEWWDYHDPREHPGAHVVRFTLRGARVESIYVGWITD